jgi:hypothetical protein
LVDTFWISNIPNATNDMESAQQNVFIFPNPVQSEFNIQVPMQGWYTVEIFGLKGELVFQQQVYAQTTKLQLSLPKWMAKGKYIMKLVNTSRDQWHMKFLYE